MMDTIDMIGTMNDMINMTVSTQTVAFIGFLNRLAMESRYGVHPFSTATKQDTKGLLYDDKHPIQSFSSSSLVYPLIADYLIDECHDDIISTWTEGWLEDGIQVAVSVDCDGACVEVTAKDDPSFYIIVNNGVWFTN